MNLKKAAEGKKELMWKDPERYPAIIDSDMVSVKVPFFAWNSQFIIQKSLQAIELELMDELKSSNTILRR